MVTAYPSLYTIIRYNRGQTHTSRRRHRFPSPRYSKSWDCRTDRPKLVSRTDRGFVQHDLEPNVAIETTAISARYNNTGFGVGSNSKLAN